MDNNDENELIRKYPRFSYFREEMNEIRQDHKGKNLTSLNKIKIFNSKDKEIRKKHTSYDKNDGVIKVVLTQVVNRPHSGLNKKQKGLGKQYSQIVRFHDDSTALKPEPLWPPSIPRNKLKRFKDR